MVRKDFRSKQCQNSSNDSWENKMNHYNLLHNLSRCVSKQFQSTLATKSSIRGPWTGMVDPRVGDP